MDPIIWGASHPFISHPSSPSRPRCFYLLSHPLIPPRPWNPNHHHLSSLFPLSSVLLSPSLTHDTLNHRTSHIRILLLTTQPQDNHATSSPSTTLRQLLHAFILVAFSLHIRVRVFFFFNKSTNFLFEARRENHGSLSTNLQNCLNLWFVFFVF